MLCMGTLIMVWHTKSLDYDEQAFNTEMSKVRPWVEWGFSKICLNFAYLDFKKILRCCYSLLGSST